jgi:uncharacterized protein (TIGR02466 family)
MNRSLLFPTAIWLDHFEIDNDKLLNFALKQKEDNTFKRAAFGNGVRTHGHEIFDDELQELRDTAQVVVDKIHEEMEYKKETKLTLTSGWIYFTGNGDWQPPHTHGSGVISCCYYIDVPEDTESALFFDDPRVQRDSREGSIPYENENALNHQRVPFFPKTKDFIAFPSWLSHYVSPNRSDKERIMISMDYELK